MKFYKYWREKFEGDFAAEIVFFREHVKSLRGHYVPAVPQTTCELAERFFRTIATMPRAPEICGPRIAVQDYYATTDRSALKKHPPGGWRGTRSQLGYDESMEGPDGRKGVLKLVEDQAPSNSHDMRLTRQSSLSGQKRVVFAFVKPAGRSHCALWLHGKDTSTRAVASFSLEDGEAQAIGVVGQGWRNAKAGMIHLRNDWWWIWLSAETDDPSALAAALLLSQATNSLYYDGDGKSGIWVFDPRIEGELVDWGW